jgi:ketosteroid isomerase-like protein
MSQENVELVRRGLSAWIEVDEGLAELSKLRAFFAPNAIFDLSTYSGWPGQTEIRGPEAFVEFRASWMKPYESWRYDAEQILDAGANGVVATFRQRGKLPESDSWVEMHYGIVYTVHNDLITRGRVYATPEEALEAAGLSE